MLQAQSPWQYGPPYRNFRLVFFSLDGVQGQSEAKQIPPHLRPTSTRAEMRNSDMTIAFIENDGPGFSMRTFIGQGKEGACSVQEEVDTHARGG